MSEITVFISYSHDSDERAERVRGLGASLSRDGCKCAIDVYKDTGEDWPTWMTRQLIEANFVLCVVTETYERRFRDKELPHVGLGVGWEAGLIRRLLYARKLHNDRIFPVFFAKAERDHIPLELQGYDSFLLDGPAGYEALLRKVLNLPPHAKPATGAPPTLATRQTPSLFARPGEAALAPGRDGLRTDISRILKYAPAELIGREEETKLLNDAWAKVQSSETGRPRILTFVALGGEGKTSLVAKWAAELAARDWPGCDAAFAWSFYSQGTREQAAATSDVFLKEALVFFASDDEDRQFAASPAGAFEKGQRLARLVGKRRSLLILDGLEPLQYAPASPTPGELKDQGLAALLKGLAAASHGLCVVTTRYSVPDLKAFWPAPASPSGRGAGGEGTVREVKLLRLSREAGVHLLKTLGVRGSEVRNLSSADGKLNEFEKLVEDVKGHALTLNLLGTYLRDAHGGDIRKRDLVKLAEADAEEQGHAFRVMDAYVKSFESEGEKGQRALALLRLLGLFDRPATADCLQALWTGAAIAGLTEALVSLSEAQRNLSLRRLEDAKLLTVQRGEATGALVALDAHPLLREYFARRLREGQPEAWRAAHRRLYEHLCASTHEGDAPTLEALQPLYQAVAHGCQAGLQQEAHDDVYLRRLMCGKKAYACIILGAFGSDLGALGCFFETQWSKPSPKLRDRDHAVLLHNTAFSLRALGRLTECFEPMGASLKMGIEEQDWGSAAIRASNLSELELTLGEVALAERDAAQSVTYADRSGDAFVRMAFRTTHADALHQAGRRAEAEARFREAEQMQAEGQPDFTLLSLWGFRYCDLLLTEAERAAWQRVFCPHPSPLPEG